MKIKNWEKYQHNSGTKKFPWIKLHASLLDDMEFHSISGEAARFLMFLWILAREQDGELPGIDKISFRLRLSIPEVETYLKEVDHWLVLDEYTEGTQCIPEGYPTDTQQGTAEEDIDQDKDIDKEEDQDRAREEKPQQPKLPKTKNQTFESKAASLKFWDVWNAYPASNHKIDTRRALKAWEDAFTIYAGTIEEFVLIVKQGIEAHVKAGAFSDPQYVPRFDRFLLEQKYMNKPKPNKKTPAAKGPARDSDEEVF